MWTQISLSIINMTGTCIMHTAHQKHWGSDFSNRRHTVGYSLATKITDEVGCIIPSCNISVTPVLNTALTTFHVLSEHYSFPGSCFLSQQMVKPSQNSVKMFTKMPWLLLSITTESRHHSISAGLIPWTLTSPPWPHNPTRWGWVVCPPSCPAMSYSPHWKRHHCSVQIPSVLLPPEAPEPGREHLMGSWFRTHSSTGHGFLENLDYRIDFRRICNSQV